jgi:amicyanin
MVVVVVATIIGIVVANNHKNSPRVITMDGMDMSNMDMNHSSDSTPATNAVEANSVAIKDFAFTQKAIKVKVGTTVTWTNNDSVQHSVVANSASADAPNGSLIGKGETYKFTFTKAGTYAYHCAPHPYMKATVEVTE